jgi:DNA repair protein RadC
VWTGETNDRPRERLLRRGPRELTDVELLAVVLRNGRSGQNAVELARTVLGMHGDVRALATARADVLAAYGGMGPAKAAAVTAAFELGRRTVELAEAVPVRRAEDVVAVARREARGVRRDELLLFVTDVANRVRWTVCVLSGLLARPALPVRRIVDTALRHGGAGFALARLSSGVLAAASPEDEEMLRRLRPAAEYAGLRLLDYVVVADADWCGVVARVPYAPEPDPPPRLPPPPPPLALPAPTEPAQPEPPPTEPLTGPAAAEPSEAGSPEARASP